jgi:hypothetical protein
MTNSARRRASAFQEMAVKKWSYERIPTTEHVACAFNAAGNPPIRPIAGIFFNQLLIGSAA